MTEREPERIGAAMIARIGLRLAFAGGRPALLRQIFTVIRLDVAALERRQHFPPSEPQVSVGAESAELYDAPLF